LAREIRKKIFANFQITNPIKAAVLGFAALIKTVPQILPIIFPFTTLFLDLQADKGVPIREAGVLCLEETIKHLDEWSVTCWLPFLLEGCSSKWQAKITACETLSRYFQF
jgi:hypothetical protein